jgi:hypothetical protein
MHVAKAFRHAYILKALRLLDITESAEVAQIQELVAAILDVVIEIPLESSLIELIVLPLFIAGVNSLALYSRHYIILRLLEIKARLEMSNAALIDLLKEVWKCRAR